MRRVGFLLWMLIMGLLLSACSAADSADCANLPANGPQIKIDSAWSRSAEVAMPSAMATPMGKAMFGTPVSSPMGGTGTKLIAK